MHVELGFVARRKGSSEGREPSGRDPVDLRLGEAWRGRRLGRSLLLALGLLLVLLAM